MDYVFAPNRSEDNLLRKALKSRPDTEIIWTKQKTPGSTKRVRVLRMDQLFDCLGSDTDIARPADNIFLVSHGSVRGALWLHLADVDGEKGDESVLTFEVLEKAWLFGIGKIPASIIGPNTKINLIACNVGKDRTLPFLKKFKEVLGGQVPVSVPKHIFYNWPIGNAGHIFHLAYDFELYVKKPFKGSTARADLIQALMNENFKLISFALATITKEFWNKWLPKKITAKRQKKMVRHHINFNPPLRDARNKEIGYRHEKFPDALDAKWERERFTVPNVSGDMKDKAKNRKAAEDYLKKKPMYKNNHEFPVFKRLGFNSNQEFFDAFNWKITPNRKKKTLRVVLSRFLYAITVPICELADPKDNDFNVLKDFNELIYNFYPHANNSHGTLLEKLNTSDTELYQTV